MMASSFLNQALADYFSPRQYIKAIKKDGLVDTYKVFMVNKTTTEYNKDDFATIDLGKNLFLQTNNDIFYI